MSFEGSLHTVPLPEVLHLLADTSKSGELYVSGPGVGGRFWFEGGAYCGFEVHRCEHAVDALFELLRIEQGDFVFDSNAQLPAGPVRPADGERSDIRPVLEQAEARLMEWNEIVAVVPSLNHDVYLVPEQPHDQVSLDRAQWALVVAVGEGRQVQEILDDRRLPEFDGCKAIKGLVDSGLAEVAEPVAPAEQAVVRPEPESAVEPEVESESEVDPESEVDRESPVLIGAVNGAGADESGSDAEAAQASQTAREALTALIDGMAAQVDRLAQSNAGEPEEEAVGSQGPADGLADRGPWTSDELASLDREDWSGEASSEEFDNAEPEVGEPTPEPINRGLLLKFLSSVRN